ncbi:MAG: hypothetical protein ACHQIL_01055 [Steroidobacterales bacterium]
MQRLAKLLPRDPYVRIASKPVQADELLTLLRAAGRLNAAQWPLSGYSMKTRSVSSSDR